MKGIILWQDIVMSIATAGFVISLIPQIIKNKKNKNSPFAMQTIILNVGCLFLVTVCMFSLKLYSTVLTNILTILMWCIIGFQTKFYKNIYNTKINGGVE